MSERLTDWYPHGSKPMRVGVYETTAEPSPCFQFWSGKTWHSCCDNYVSAANIGAKYISEYQAPQWRGLASDPNA